MIKPKYTKRTTYGWKSTSMSDIYNYGLKYWIFLTKIGFHENFKLKKWVQIKIFKGIKLPDLKVLLNRENYDNNKLC